MLPASFRADPAFAATVATPPLIRVMVVDDSLVARRVVSRILEDDGRFSVVGSHSDTARALDALGQCHVDIVLLDIEMPGRNGVESLSDLRAASGGAMIVMLSGHHGERDSLALQAFALGASDVIEKPVAGHFSAAFASGLTDRLIALHQGGDRICWTGEIAPSARPQQTGIVTPPRAIGIGASTGGVHALSALLAAFDRPPRVPIFVTQHLPADFLEFFATQLTRQCPFPVQVAAEGMQILPGQVYIAPGHAHLAVRRATHRRVEIEHSRARSRHAAFPAVDPMLTSLAEIYDKGACGIILSGMGRDGLAGAQAINRVGGTVIAQDSSSSVVWGMPGAVVQAGLANLVASPEDAARALTKSWEKLA
jgi:two-component system chemotaxis response regulator CheB